MSLAMIQPRDKFLLKQSVIARLPVISHLRTVLGSFAVKVDANGKQVFERFYIGITSDLDRRFTEHRGKDLQFKWMCPIYEEPDSHLGENSFDLLEHEALMAFKGGIRHPKTQEMMLTYANLREGSPPKRCLYILVG